MSASKTYPASAPDATKRGLAALMVAHCAGMVDLVALPVWIGTLVARFQFDAQQAGALMTLFLMGAAGASVLFAGRFGQHDPKRVVVSAFGVAAALLFVMSRNTAFSVLAALHLAGGFSAGLALTFTHGSIGRTTRPHRNFAFAGLAIGTFGVVFLGVAPQVIDAHGGAALFLILAGVMAIAGVVGLLFFPRAPAVPAAHANVGLPLGRGVWHLIVAVALMCTVQAMGASFMERIGMARGFGRDAVNTALITFGIVTLLPGPMAGLLERRLPAAKVVCTLPVLQALAVLTLTHTQNYMLFVVACALLPFTIIFIHTFAFGLLAQLDPSGRAAAATPAMLMVGAATGPLISGTLVKFFGFEAIGYAVVGLVALELIFFNLARLAVRRMPEARAAKAMAGQGAG